MEASNSPFPCIHIPYLPERFDTGHDVFSVDMSLAHNSIITGLNSVWNNAPRVRPSDVLAFAGYTLTCLAVIHEHHKVEEEIIFPFLNTKLDMGHNLEQHEDFDKPMSDFEEYMKAVQLNKEEYDGEKTRKLLKDFADLLVPHLHEEILTIVPERLEVFEKADFDGMLQRLQKHIEREPGFWDVFPFVYSHIDQQVSAHWPPIPMALKFCVRHIFSWRYSSYWKFSPYTFYGERQTYNP